MSRHTPATPKPEEHYRVASVLEVLAEYGIHVARETINRVSDTVLELDTRSTGMFDRRWTRSQIDDLAAAFRLREQRGLTWGRRRPTLSPVRRSLSNSTRRWRRSALS